jgi:AcrR family transcriptional regulator
VTRRASGGRAYSAPFDDPLGELTPAAQKILEAASRLLVTEGYDALTHERIAKAAGVNKSSIRNSFGSKAALVAAVVDAMVHDGCLGLSATLEGASAQERVHGAVGGIREMIDTDAFAGYFDILPHALRDDDLRARILALYRWWFGENRKWLGMTADAQADPERARLQAGVAQLVAAVIDGLSIQDALDPEYDAGPALDALAVLLETAMPALTVPEEARRSAGGDGSDGAA